MKYIDKIIEYGILLFVFLIPWQARLIIKSGEINGGYWEYGTASLYATEVLLGLILLAIVFKSMSCWRPKADSIPVLIREILSVALRATSRMTGSSGVLFLIIWSGISIVWSIDRGVALQHFVFLVLAGAVFVILRGVRMSIGTTERIHLAIILSAAVQGAIALIQFFSQSIFASTIIGMSAQSASTLGASVVETMDGRWLRAYGTFPHPNILGAWLVLGMLVWFFVPKWRSSIFKYSSFVIILSGLLTTFSRSAWLAFGIGLLFVIASEVKRVWQSHRLSTGFLVSLGMTVCIVFVFAGLFPSPFFSRLSSNNRLEIKSTEERTASLSQGWQIIKQNPLTGVGIGNYGLGVHKYLDNTKPAWYYQPTHNIFLLIWSELGLIGVLFIILFILSLQAKSKIQLFYFLPLLILLSLDHYFWSLYSGMMILAIWLILAKKHTFSSSSY